LEEKAFFSARYDQKKKLFFVYWSRQLSSRVKINDVMTTGV